MDYKIFPYRFERLENEVFVSNEVGEYVYLSESDFNSFINHKLRPLNESYKSLKSKQILSDSNHDDVIEMLATKYRTKKHFLTQFTSLHMVVVTLRCNSNCCYCQVSKKNIEDIHFDMDKTIAKKVIEKIFETPSLFIKIEFQGGEPLLNFEIVKYIIETVEWKNIFKKKNLEFVICTNLTLIDEKKLKWLKNHKVYISTSLDGPSILHNKNRPLQNTNNSYDLIVEKINLCRRFLGEDSVSALMTATSHSIGKFEDIINTYVKLGFSSIFLRSLNPYGFAKRNKNFLAYPIEAFLDNYKRGLEYILKLNLEGTYFREEFATIILSRILTPFSTGFVDLQSPAGIGIAGVIYDYDGDVYVSDEGRMLASMGDKKFKIGNVCTNNYQEIFNSNYLHELTENSCAESLPQCSTCAYLSYCGADPVRNYSEQGDIIGHRPTSQVCNKNMGVIKFILSILKENDPNVNKVLWSWILRKSITI